MTGPDSDGPRIGCTLFFASFVFSGGDSGDDGFPELGSFGPEPVGDPFCFFMDSLDCGRENTRCQREHFSGLD